VQLALVFLLSNLLPALVLTPALGWCRSLLEWLVPSELGDVPGKPRYLTTSALRDPGTGIILLEKELARLIGMLTVDPSAESDAADGEHHAAPAFVALGQAIEQFAARLATTGELSETQAARLQSLRGALSTVRHLEDAIAGVCHALLRLGAHPGEAAGPRRLAGAPAGGGAGAGGGGGESGGRRGPSRPRPHPRARRGHPEARPAAHRSAPPLRPARDADPGGSTPEGGGAAERRRRRGVDRASTRQGARPARRPGDGGRLSVVVEARDDPAHRARHRHRHRRRRRARAGAGTGLAR